MASHKDLVAVGRVVKPHGVRGECCVQSYAETPDLFERLGQVRLVAEGADPARGRALTVRSGRPHQGRWLLTFEGVADRDAAEALRDMEVMIPVAGLPPLAEDELLLMDLPGLEVRLPSGDALGRIARVDTPAGQEIWVIETPQGEVLFPAAPEFVRLVDLERGLAVIDPPPGLLDLYLRPASTDRP